MYRWLMKTTATVLFGLVFALISQGIGRIPDAFAAGEVWTFVDGGTSTGLNSNTVEVISTFPSISSTASYNDELYVAWCESNNGDTFHNQVRVKKRKSDGTWVFVDNGTLNYNANSIVENAKGPVLAVYDNKLYAAWSEHDSRSAIDRDHVVVKSYNGTSWTSLNPGSITYNQGLPNQVTYTCYGLNHAFNADAINPTLIVNNEKLYVAWCESGFGSSKIAVKEYDRVTGGWVFIDARTPVENHTFGLNFDLTKSTYFPRLMSLNDELYATWTENNSSNIGQLRVKKYDGNGSSWSFVDGGGASGLNRNTSIQATGPGLMACKGSLYLTWQEATYNDPTWGRISQIRVKRYNGGNSWSFIDGNNDWGLNIVKANDAYNPTLTVYNDKLYVSWDEMYDVNGDGSSWPTQIRVAKYEGTSFAFIDGGHPAGLNYNTNKNAGNPALTTFNGKLYGAWQEDDGTVKRIHVKMLPLPAFSAGASAASSTPTAGVSNIITLTVKDGAGNTDNTFSGGRLVTVSGYTAAPNSTYGSFNGTALTASPNIVSVTFTNGVASPSLVLNKAPAQTQTIGFSIAGVNTPATNTVTITPIPASATTMNLTQDITAPVTNGVQFAPQPQITLKDSFGNICTNNNSTVITASQKDSGDWTLTGTKTATAGAGVATFGNLGATNIPTVVGAQLAFDATGGLTQITSSGVTLPVAPAYTAGASAASSTPTAGVSNIITLTVKDGAGNTDNTFSGGRLVTVSGYAVAPNSTYGSFNGTALTASPVSVTFTNGVATPSLVLNKAAAQTIGFSIAGVNTPATNTVTITPVPASAATMNLTQDITAPPTNGGQFAQQPKVTLIDSFGNICTNNGSKVVSASRKDSGDWTLTGTTTATASAEGVATFDNLGATNAAQVIGAKIAFDTTELTQITSSTVTLPAPPLSSNANLSSLTLSSGTLNPVFAADTTTYSVSVNNRITSITITPTVAESHATVTVNTSSVNSGQASQVINLNVGANPINIVVTAQNTTTKTYTVTVTRAVPDTSAKTLIITTPASVQAGIPFSMTVEARDISGNRATGYQGTVSFTSTDLAASLPGNYTFILGDLGIKTFNVTFDSLGSKKITVRDTAKIGLAGYWNFDEGSGTTVEDYSDRGNAATLHGAVWSTEAPGEDFSNPGSIGTTVGYASTSSLPTTQVDNITLSTWVKLNELSSGYKKIAYIGNSASNGYGLYLDNGNIDILCGGVNFVLSNQVLSTGSWQHLCAVRVDGVWHLYLNGYEIGLTYNNTIPIIPLESEYIGGYSGGENFNGFVDEVRLYERALSAGEIADLADGANLLDNTSANINAAAVPPQLNSVVTSSDGLTLTLTFDKEMSDPSGKHGSFTVTADNLPISVSAVALGGSDHKLINLTMGQVHYGQTVKVAYTAAAGQITSSDGGSLEVFADDANEVENNATAAPTVTGVSPSSGNTAGGTSVTITGTNFYNGSANASVSFGGTVATNITVVNSTTITCTSPAKSAGKIDVTVTTASGTSATGSGDEFTYYADPTQLVWHTQPGGAESGAELSPQPILYLEDANGNLEAGDSSSTVTLALTSANGAILGGSATVTLNGGIATFTNLKVDKAGTYTLTPTSSLAGIFSPVSNSLVVTTACLATYRGAQKRHNDNGTYDIRFIATIDTLEADSVGFIFSKSNTNPTKDNVPNAQVKSTTTVYNSVTAAGSTVYASDLHGTYIIACTVTGIPDTDINTSLNVRAFSTRGTETLYTSVQTVTVSSLH